MTSAGVPAYWPDS